RELEPRAPLEGEQERRRRQDALAANHGEIAFRMARPSAIPTREPGVPARPRVCGSAGAGITLRRREEAHMDAKLWHDMFHLGVPVAEKMLRPVVVYAFLVVGLRLAGKRELAQLNPFDLIVLLTLSNTVQNAIIG